MNEITLVNRGEHTITILLHEQGQVILRDGDAVSIAQDHAGRFVRIAHVHGAKKIRRRLVRQLRRGERKNRPARAWVSS